MQKLLQGLEPGDTVSFVNSEGLTCPAVLVSKPLPICLADTGHETVTAQVVLLGGQTTQSPIASIYGGAQIGMAAMYSADQQPNSFFLSEKQQWLLDNWLVWKNGLALAAETRERESWSAPQFPPHSMGGDAILSDIGASETNLASIPIGGPMQGGAQVDAPLHESVQMRGAGPRGAETREQELVGAETGYGGTPPPEFPQH